MPRISPRLQGALETVGWTAAFALAYAQSPLYTSNQNQYFLHGLARAGFGYLSADWLVHTAEPTPLFSFLVQSVASILPAWTFYVIYAGLMGVYLFSLLAIAGSVFDLRAPDRRRLVLALLVVLHSAALRFVLARFVVPEAEFILEGGVAGQRLLGAVLQPSSFGVLLVLSVALFLRQQPILSVLALGAACAIHPTYLLSSGVLLATYVAIRALQPGRRQDAVVLALVGVAVLAPTAFWAYATFRPSGADLYARASDILIRLRLPHHAIPAKWLDVTVALQAVLLVAAIVVARRSPLAVILSAGGLFVVAATALQMLTGDPTLALLFPWRLSTVLVPVSTACVAAAAAGVSLDLLASRPRLKSLLLAGSLAAVVLAASAGVFRFGQELETQRRDPAAAMMEFVAATVAPGQIYLVDPKLQDFRLRTGAPIVVDAKAIPYRDAEVAAWFDRLKVARNLYRPRTEWLDCPSVATAHERYGATHVVGPEALGPACPQLVQLYNDRVYAVYRIQELR
jgi:hypothetical protein